jgi:hypothetical protein
MQIQASIGWTRLPRTLPCRWLLSVGRMPPPNLEKVAGRIIPHASFSVHPHSCFEPCSIRSNTPPQAVLTQGASKEIATPARTATPPSALLFKADDPPEHHHRLPNNQIHLTSLALLHRKPGSDTGAHAADHITPLSWTVHHVLISSKPIRRDRRYVPPFACPISAAPSVFCPVKSR